MGTSSRRAPTSRWPTASRARHRCARVCDARGPTRGEGAASRCTPRAAARCTPRAAARCMPLAAARRAPHAARRTLHAVSCSRLRPAGAGDGSLNDPFRHLFSSIVATELSVPLVSRLRAQ
eukprot:3834416-Prymnesium_polylepis.1